MTTKETKTSGFSLECWAPWHFYLSTIFKLECNSCNQHRFKTCLIIWWCLCEWHLSSHPISAQSKPIQPGCLFHPISPHFEPVIWNVHEASFRNEHHTNNYSKTWNNHFTQLLGHVHPSVWKATHRYLSNCGNHDSPRQPKKSTKKESVCVMIYKTACTIFVMITAMAEETLNSFCEAAVKMSALHEKSIKNPVLLLVLMMAFLDLIRLQHTMSYSMVIFMSYLQWLPLKWVLHVSYLDI